MGRKRPNRFPSSSPDSHAGEGGGGGGGVAYGRLIETSPALATPTIHFPATPPGGTRPPLFPFQFSTKNSSKIVNITKKVRVY